MEFLETILHLLKEYKYSKYVYHGMVALCVAALAVITVQADFGEENFNVWLYILACLLVVAITIVLCLLCAKERRFPKFKDDETGIMFLIKTNGPEDRMMVEKYFISAIKKAFQDNYKHKNKILFLESYHADKFLDADMEKKKEIIWKSNAKLAFFGECITGNRNGKKVCYINLESCVSHDALHENGRMLLSMDMSVVMVPFKQLYINEDNNLDEFQCASVALSLIADFIMASALFYTRHFEESVEFFADLMDKLENIFRNLPSIAALKSFVPVRWWQNHLLLSKEAYARYRVGKNPAELETMYRHLQESAKHNKENSFYNTQMALYYFCKDRDVKNAKACVKVCKDHHYPEFAYKFDDVFLALYEKYTPYLAMRCYKKYTTIFRKKPPYEMCVEIEEFIYDVIDKEPDKGHLYWLLVLLTNYRGDFVLSKEALQKFEEVPGLVLNEDMEKYIEKMKRYNEDEICFLQGDANEQ